MMKDLFFQTSFGESGYYDGTTAMSNVEGLVDEHRVQAKWEFNTFVFGFPLENVSDAKSPLFCCRNIIASIDGTLVTDFRTASFSSELSDARKLVVEKIPSAMNLVVIEIMTIDGEQEELRMLFNGLYDIINHEMYKHYGVCNTEVCLWVNAKDKERILALDLSCPMIVCDNAIIFHE